MSSENGFALASLRKGHTVSITFVMTGNCVMQSKNKKAQNKSEHSYVARLAQQDCVVCDAPGPSEVHEFTQGQWFTSVPLCAECHRGQHGWHGTRDRWKNRKVDMLESINRAVARSM